MWHWWLPLLAAAAASAATAAAAAAAAADNKLLVVLLLLLVRLLIVVGARFEVAAPLLPAPAAAAPAPDQEACRAEGPAQPGKKQYGEPPGHCSADWRLDACKLQLMSCRERKQHAASSRSPPSSIAAPTLAPTIMRMVVVLRELLLLLLLLLLVVLPAGRPAGGGRALPLALPNAALSAAASPPSAAAPSASSTALLVLLPPAALVSSSKLPSPAAPSASPPVPSSPGVVRVSSGAVTSSVVVTVVSSLSESTSTGSGLPSQALMYATTSRLQGRPPSFRQRTLMLYALGSGQVSSSGVVAQPVEGSDVAEACLPSESTTSISYWLDPSGAKGSCGRGSGGGGSSMRAGSGNGKGRQGQEGSAHRLDGWQCCSGHLACRAQPAAGSIT